MTHDAYDWASQYDRLDAKASTASTHSCSYKVVGVIRVMRHTLVSVWSGDWKRKPAAAGAQSFGLHRRRFAGSAAVART